MTAFDAKPYLKALGRKIRGLRAAQGYSQEGFADKCGVHRTFMGTVERGESNLSFSNILRVAKTLGVPLSTLFENLEPAIEVLNADGSPIDSSNSQLDDEGPVPGDFEIKKRKN